MGPEKEGESHLFDTQREPVTESPLTDTSAEVSPGSGSRDNDKVFRDMIDIVTDLERQLEHSGDLNQTLQEEIEDVRAGREEAESLAAVHTQEMERFQEDISSLQAMNERLMAELDASEEERREAAEEINRLIDEQEDRKQEIRSFKEKSSSLANILELTEREAASREKHSQEMIQRLKRDIEELEKSLKQATQELHRANSLADNLSRVKKRLDTDMAYLERTRNQMYGILKGVQEGMLTREASPCSPGFCSHHTAERSEVPLPSSE